MIQKSIPKPNRVIGLDMHPDVFTAALMSSLEPLASKAEKIWDKIPTPHLKSWAQKHLRTGDLVVIEASENTFEVASRLEALGVSVFVLESYRAAQIRNSQCHNDKVCAVQIARAFLGGSAKRVWTPDPATRERREILHAYIKSTREATRLTNRIKSFLNEHCVRTPKGLSLHSDKGRQWILSAHAWSATAQSILTHYLESLQQASQQEKQFSQIMANQVSQDPQLLKLMRLMGVRHIIAYAIAAIIGDISRFKSPKSLVSYIGLAPRVTQSGNSHRTGGLPHTGRKDLRSLIIQGAHTALRCRNHPLHDWAMRLMMRKGVRNIAVSAVARKMVVSIWYLLNGRFTSLDQIDKTLDGKIYKLATTIGVHQIKARGFSSKPLFVEHLRKTILNTH